MSLHHRIFINVGGNVNVYLEALSVPALDGSKVRMPLKNPRGFTVFL